MLNGIAERKTGGEAKEATEEVYQVVLGEESVTPRVPRYLGVRAVIIHP